MSSGYVVAAFAIGLFWVCGAWNRQEERFTSMGLLCFDEELNFIVCQACNKKESTQR